MSGRHVNEMAAFANTQDKVPPLEISGKGDIQNGQGNRPSDPCIKRLPENDRRLHSLIRWHSQSLRIFLEGRSTVRRGISCDGFSDYCCHGSIIVTFVESDWD